jgi:hypothetical protein
VGGRGRLVVMLWGREVVEADVCTYRVERCKFFFSRGQLLLSLPRVAGMEGRLYKGFNVNVFFLRENLLFMSPSWLCRCLLDIISLLDRGGTVYLGADVVLTPQAYVSDLTFCRRSHAPRYRVTFQMYTSKLQISFSHTATDSSNLSTHKCPPKEPSQDVKNKYHPLAHPSESPQRHSITRSSHPKCFIT